MNIIMAIIGLLQNAKFEFAEFCAARAGVTRSYVPNARGALVQETDGQLIFRALGVGRSWIVGVVRVLLFVTAFFAIAGTIIGIRGMILHAEGNPIAGAFSALGVSVVYVLAGLAFLPIGVLFLKALGTQGSSRVAYMEFVSFGVTSILTITLYAQFVDWGVSSKASAVALLSISIITWKVMRKITLGKGIVGFPVVLAVLSLMGSTTVMAIMPAYEEFFVDKAVDTSAEAFVPTARVHELPNGSLERDEKGEVILYPLDQKRKPSGALLRLVSEGDIPELEEAVGKLPTTQSSSICEEVNYQFLLSRTDPGVNLYLDAGKCLVIEFEREDGHFNANLYVLEGHVRVFPGNRRDLEVVDWAGNTNRPNFDTMLGTPGLATKWTIRPFDEWSGAHVEVVATYD